MRLWVSGVWTMDVIHMAGKFSGAKTFIEQLK